MSLSQPGLRFPPLVLVLAAASACAMADAPDEPPAAAADEDLPGKFDAPGCARGLERFFASCARAGHSGDDLLSSEIWRIPRTARGGGEIQMSWEFEIMSQENVPQWYRSSSMSTAEWDSLPRWRQTGIMRRGGADLVRRDDAPEWIREIIKREGRGAYETTSRTYVRTIDDLYGQAKTVQSTMGYDGGFHYHVTFPWGEGMQPHARSMRALLQRGNEYTTYRWLSAGRNWDNGVIRPVGVDVLDDIERAMASGDATRVSHKFTTIGWRTGIYGDPTRVGFEIRSISQEIDDAGRIVESLVRGAEDPAGAVIKFGPEGLPYRLADAGVGDWIGRGSYSTLPPDVQAFFEGARSAARAGESARHAWSLPMVSLESRPQIPAEAGRLVVAERQSFLEAIRGIARAFDGQPITAEAAKMIQSAVSDFCRATRPAWEYL